MRTWDEPGAVAVSIRDEGPGIEASVQRRMFEPYFTTKPEHRGLGLSACWGIVERHHGRVEVESAPRTGATFTVRIPLAGATGSLPCGERRGSLPRLDLLVVEDNPVLRHQLQGELRNLGHTVTLASNGWDAMHRFNEAAFDVVITDLHMPLMGGLEVAREIKRRSPRTPVVLLATLAECSALGPVEHVDQVGCKPVTSRCLDQVLHQVLVPAGAGPLSRRT